MLSMDSLLARLAFLQTVWLLSRERKKKINVKKVNVYNERVNGWTIKWHFLPQHLLSMPLYLNHHRLFIWLSVLLLGHLLQILKKTHNFLFILLSTLKYKRDYRDTCCFVRACALLPESVIWDSGKSFSHLRWVLSACFEDPSTQWYPERKSKRYSKQCLVSATLTCCQHVAPVVRLIDSQ